MKLKQRLCALFLAGSMVLCTTASATTFKDQKKITQTAAVEIMDMLGIMSGYSSGKFEPEQAVTRAEMAKMLFVMCTGSSDASNYSGVSVPFLDLKDCWALNYIKYAYSQGLLNGKSSWEFAPNDTITATEASKMLLILDGYNSDRCGFSGAGWDGRVLRYASESGLLDGMDISLADALPRQYAARLLMNAIEIDYVNWSTNNNRFVPNGSTLGKRMMRLNVISGVLLGAMGAAIDDQTIGLVQARIMEDGKHSATLVNNMTRNYIHLLGKHVKAYSRTSGITYGLVADDYNVVDEDLKGSKIKSIDGENRITVDKTDYSVNTTDGILFCYLDAQKNDDGEYEMVISTQTVKDSPLLLADALKKGNSSTAHVISNDGDYMIDVIVYYTSTFIKQFFVDGK